MKLMNKTNFVIVLIILAASFFIQKFWLGSDIKAYEFTGSIQKIDGQTIYMRGNYNVPDHPELRNESQAFDAKVEVKSGTKFVRITIYRPADLGEQLKAGKVVDPGELKREVKPGSLEDLVSGRVEGAVVETNNSIYNKRSFVAQSITYYYPVDAGDIK